MANPCSEWLATQQVTQPLARSRGSPGLVGCDPLVLSRQTGCQRPVLPTRLPTTCGRSTVDEVLSVPQPPTGNITLMFTDIQESTALWERMGDGFCAVLDRHNELIRQLVAQWDGYEVKTEGDAFMVAFDRATDAVHCAADVQRALSAEPWPEEAGELLVRIGIHSGEPFLGYDADGRVDYFGSMVSRAARVSQAGHGGQVLVSSATREMVRDALTTDFELVDLGKHQLRGLEEAVQLFEVHHPELPARTHPPLRTLEASLTNLPAEPTTFIGRAREIAALMELLDRPKCRLVTLTGSAGCGKTRLALQVAASVLDERPDGVWLTELAPLTDPALVPQAVAAALGVREQPGRPLMDTLREHLRAKNLLLVLDNCEHLIEACAEWAGAVLRACPETRLLATSREALRLPEETVWSVLPLAAPQSERAEEWSLEALSQYDAVRLFVDRASAASSGFQVTNANARAVAQICWRLDGIPLAIELAAARVRAMPAEQIAARLDDRFRLLTGGSRTALPRQQTLQALIDWSYDLLTEQESILFRRVSVFAGGWTLEAAVAVCSGDGIEECEVLDLLTDLVNKSVVVYEEQEGEARYRMLQTMRQYAGDRLLESAEARALRGRHRDHFVALVAEPAARPKGLSEADWFGYLQFEHDNCRAALDWCRETEDGIEAGLRLVAALQDFWDSHGHLSEGRQRSEAALSRADDAPPELRAAALRGAGGLAVLQGDLSAARAHLQEALTLFRQLRRNMRVASCLNGLAQVANQQGDLPRAWALFEESLALSREARDAGHTGYALHGLAFVAYRRGDQPEAQALFEEQLALARESGDERQCAIALAGLALAVSGQGDDSTAQKLLEESVAIRRELGDKRAWAHGLSDLGLVLWRQGDNERAQALLEESLAILRAGGERRAVAVALPRLAAVLGAQGHVELAAQVFGAAEALREAVGTTLAPDQTADWDRSVGAVREALGEEAFEQAWAEGRGMTTEEAIACALVHTPHAQQAPLCGQHDPEKACAFPTEDQDDWVHSP